MKTSRVIKAVLVIPALGVFFTNGCGPGISLRDIDTRVVGKLDVGFAVARVFTLDGGFDSDDNGHGLVSVGTEVIFVGGKTQMGADSQNLIAKLNPQGILDSNFGSVGLKHFDIGTKGDQIEDLLLDSSQRLYALSTTREATDRMQCNVSRLTTGGDLDPTFGTGGFATLDFSTYLGSSAITRCSTVNLQLNAIFVPGDAQHAEGVGGGGRDAFIAKLNLDGSLDLGFDGNGMLGIPFSGVFDSAFRHFFVDTDHLIAGYWFDTPNAKMVGALLKFNYQGVAVSSFGSNGRTNFSVGQGNTRFYDMALLPDGSVLAVGAGQATSTSDRDMLVAKFLANGEPDVLFGENGYRLFAVGSFDDEVNHIVVTPAGQILVAGYSKNGTDEDGIIVALNSDGSIDTHFADQGVFRFDSGKGNDSFKKLLLIGSSLYASGYAASDGHSDLLVIKLD